VHKFDESVTARSKYTELKPDDPDGWDDLGHSLRHAKRRKEAIAAYKKYIEKENRPDSDELIELAKKHIASLEKAERVATATLANAEERALVAAQEHREKAKALRAALKNDEAAAEFEAAIKADPKDEYSLHELGMLLLLSRKYDAAISRFQAAVELDRHDSLAWFNLGFASQKAKKFDQAADAYAQFNDLEPRDPDGWRDLADCFRLANKRREAIIAYKGYIAREKRPNLKKDVERAKEYLKELEQAAPPPSR
jgi:tetratricopeptide (TPR) repeat protein